MAAGKRWTRDELLVALNLYHKLTFGQLHARHPAIMVLAEKLERGANSMAMKLCNHAPGQKNLRGIPWKMCCLAYAVFVKSRGAGRRV